MSASAIKGLTTAQAEAERHEAWERFLATPHTDPERKDRYHAELRAITKREAHHEA